MMGECVDQRGWRTLGTGVAAHGAPYTYKNKPGTMPRLPSPYPCWGFHLRISGLLSRRCRWVGFSSSSAAAYLGDQA